MIDPITGLAAWKTAVETVKQTIDLVRTIVPASGGSDEQKRALEKALVTASSTTALAEVELAKAFGYELCKCAIPPTPMLTVGHRLPFGEDAVETVYECPKCGFNTAGPWQYTRTAPPRAAKG